MVDLAPVADALNAPQPAVSVGQGPRVNPTINSGIGAAADAVGDVVARGIQFHNKAVEGSAISDYLDKAQAMINGVQQSSGAQLDDGDKGALTDAATAQQKFDKMAQQGMQSQSAIRMLQLQTLRDFVSKRPYLAGEFTQLLGSSSQFVDSLYAAKNNASIAQSQATLQMVRDSQGKAAATNPEVMGMSPGEYMNWGAKSGYFQQQNIAGVSEREAATAANLYQYDQTTAKKNFQTALATGMPIWQRNFSTSLQAIMDGPGSPAEKKLQIGAFQVQYLSNVRQQPAFGNSAIMMPQEFNQAFGWVADQAKIAQDIASGGTAAQEAQYQADFLKSTQTASFYKQHPDYTPMQLTMELTKNAPPSLIGEQAKQAITPAMSDLASTVVGSLSNKPVDMYNDLAWGKPDAGKRLDGSAAFVANQQGVWDQLPPAAQDLAGQHVINMIRSGVTAGHSDDVMDKLLPVMADQKFQNVAGNQKFTDGFGAPEQKALTDYIKGMNDAGAKQLQKYNGQVGATISPDGIPQLVAAPTMTAMERNNVAQINVRVDRSIRAMANLQHMPLKQAAKEYYNTYWKAQ